MGIQLREYQSLAIERAVTYLLGERDPTVPRKLYAAPTGSGKSVIMVGVKHRLDDAGFRPAIVAPTDEILKGFAKKDDRVDYAKYLSLSPAKRKSYLESLGYWTPIRLRNVLLKGSTKAPTHLLIDEAHHHEAATYELLDALSDNRPTVGYTGSPYRGSARSTEKFREKWGLPEWIITMPEAVKYGYMGFPTCKIVPLLDDDVIEVSNGEFVVKQVEDQVISVTDRLVKEVKARCREVPDEHSMPLGGASVYRPKRPTMLALPSVFAAKHYAAALRGVGIDADLVIGETKDADRDLAYAKCVGSESVLVQVHVVGEGVDLPVRCLIDLSPMMSPVQWIQQFGRVTRPVAEGEDPPEYVCTNRNLLRHAYLLEGLLPPEVYAKGEQVFEGPSKRRTVRALGFEGLGKFTTDEVPLHNGTTGQLVVIQRLENNVVTEYAAMASPLHSDVLYARRENVRLGQDPTTGRMRSEYGRWVRIDKIPDLSEGFASVKSGAWTTNMERQWKTYGRWYGLDNEATVGRRAYVALPLLRNTNFRFR